MRTPNRRRFLLGSLGVAAAPFFPWDLQVRAAPVMNATQRRFIFVYVPGGWDQLLFLDPRETEFELPRDQYQAEAERTQVETNYSELTPYYHPQGLFRPFPENPEFSFGPAVAGYNRDGTLQHPRNLASLAERGIPMSIVRGVNVGTLGHEPGYLYHLTGEPSVGSAARGASVPVRIAAQLGGLDPALAGTIVPTVTLGVDSFTDSREGRYAALRFSSIDETQRILARPASLVEAPEVETELALFAERFGDGMLSSQLQAARSQTEEIFAAGLAERFQFLSRNDEESRAIRDRYNLGRDGGRGGPLAFAAQAIKSNLAQLVSVRLPGGGDSHGGGSLSHSRGLLPALVGLASMIEDLADSPAESLEGSWLDHTTIIVFSEFARTPRFNVYGGRDHHLTSSVLLAGAGVRGASVVGASSEVGQHPLPYDFENQQLAAEGAGRDITPKDLAATLLASAGLEYWEYRGAEPLWASLTVTPY